MSGPVALGDAGLREFWTERHLCTLTTLRRDGSPHVVAVGATLDPVAAVARVISSATSAHVRHIRNGQDRVAVCQVDGARWATVERRYAARYRIPRPNPQRVVIEISITKVLGSNRFREVASPS
jgi:predicted pyridoxine 5'-phosphate oxidase superfamily flavin-nucleotide-binding protein